MTLWKSFTVEQKLFRFMFIHARRNQLRYYFGKFCLAASALQKHRLQTKLANLKAERSEDAILAASQERKIKDMEQELTDFLQLSTTRESASQEKISDLQKTLRKQDTLVQQLQHDREEKQAALDGVRAQSQTAEFTIDALQKKAGKLQLELFHKDVEVSEGKKLNDNLRQKCAAAESKLESIITEAGALRKKLSIEEKKSKELQKKLSSEEENSKELQKRLSSEEENSKELQKKLSSEEENSKELQKRLSSEEENSKELQKKLSSEEENSKELQKKLVDSQTRCTNYATECSMMSEKRRAIEKDKARLRQQLQDLKAVMHQRCEGMASELMALSQSYEELRTTSARLHHDSEACKQAMDELQIDIAGRSKVIERLRHRNQSHEKIVEALEKELCTANEKRTSAEQNILELRVDRDNALGSLAQERKLHELEKARLEGVAERLQNALSNSRKGFEELDNQRLDVEAQLQATRRNLNAEKQVSNGLKMSITAHKDENTGLLEEISALQSDIAAKQSHVEHLTHEAARDREELNESASRERRHMQRIHTLDDELHAANEKLASAELHKIEKVHLERSMERLHVALSESHKTYEKLDTERLAVEAQLQTARRNLNAEKQVSSDLKATILLRNTELEKIKASMDDLLARDKEGKRRLAEMEAKAREYQIALDEKDSELKQLFKQSQSDVSTHNARGVPREAAMQYEEELKKAKEQIGSLHALVQQNTDNESMRNLKIQQLEQEKQLLTEEVESHVLRAASSAADEAEVLRAASDDSIHLMEQLEASKQETLELRMACAQLTEKENLLHEAEHEIANLKMTAHAALKLALSLQASVITVDEL
eukprot:g2582.t1